MSYHVEAKSPLGRLIRQYHAKRAAEALWLGLPLMGVSSLTLRLVDQQQVDVIAYGGLIGSLLLITHTLVGYLTLTSLITSFVIHPRRVDPRDTIPDNVWRAMLEQWDQVPPTSKGQPQRPKDAAKLRRMRDKREREEVKKNGGEGGLWQSMTGK